MKLIKVIKKASKFDNEIIVRTTKALAKNIFGNKFDINKYKNMLKRAYEIAISKKGNTKDVIGIFKQMLQEANSGK